MARRRRGVPVSVYLTEDAYEKLVEIIDQSGMSMSEVVRNALDLYHTALFQNQENKTEDPYIAIQKAMEILKTALASRVPIIEHPEEEA